MWIQPLSELYVFCFFLLMLLTVTLYPCCCCKTTNFPIVGLTKDYLNSSYLVQILRSAVALLLCPPDCCGAVQSEFSQTAPHQPMAATASSAASAPQQTALSQVHSNWSSKRWFEVWNTCFIFSWTVWHFLNLSFHDSLERYCSLCLAEMSPQSKDLLIKALLYCTTSAHKLFSMSLNDDHVYLENKEIQMGSSERRKSAFDTRNDTKYRHLWQIERGDIHICFFQQHKPNVL